MQASGLLIIVPNHKDKGSQTIISPESVHISNIEINVLFRNSFPNLVDLVGVEPTTSSLQGMRSPN